METNAGNYQANIHDVAYEANYRTPKLTACGLINTAGRKGESLNGRWNFGVDWYDTCRRAGWHKEITTNAQGSPEPVDWDWEAWE
ncbi:MAG: hypothetical protein FWD36_06715, partial [Treponema sp.]|nr:hypothetical protein [Treponema sp.]